MLTISQTIQPLPLALQRITRKLAAAAYRTFFAAPGADGSGGILGDELTSTRTLNDLIVNLANVALLQEV